MSFQDEQDTPAVEIDLPSDPAMRKMITDTVANIVGHLIKTAAAKDQLKEEVAKVAKDTGVKKAQIQQWARWKFAGDTAAREAAAKVTTSEAAFDILFNPTVLPPGTPTANP